MRRTLRTKPNASSGPQGVCVLELVEHVRKEALQREDAAEGDAHPPHAHPHRGSDLEQAQADRAHLGPCEDRSP